MRPLTRDELAALGIYTDGVHDTRRTVVWASGSATVRASGSATVRASGSATVTAYDSATVTASGSATVTAYDSAKVHTGGQAVCTAWQGTSLVLTRSDQGVVIDRRGEKSVAHTDGEGLDGWRYVNGSWIAETT